jgi:hypothetical protein
MSLEPEWIFGKWRGRGQPRINADKRGWNKIEVKVCEPLPKCFVREFCGEIAALAELRRGHPAEEPIGY